MARGPNEKVAEAYNLYKAGMKLIDIADNLDIPAGTVRRWKSTYKWDGENQSERSDKKSERSDKRRGNKKKAIAQEVDDVIENAELTDKQRLFCIYYVRCFNATKAYQKAYECGYTTAVTNGPALLGNTRIKEMILQLKQERLNREFLSEADIFQKYIDIAFADITDYLEFGTEEVPVMTMYGPAKIKDEETGKEKQLTKVVNVVRFKESCDIDGTILSEVKQGKDGASIKLSDRMKALQWLADHMDLATEKQKAEIAVLQAKVQAPAAETEDDGFLEALNGSSREDWSNEED